MQILNLQYSPYQNGKISGEYFKKNVKIDIGNIKIKIDKNICAADITVTKKFVFSKYKIKFTCINSQKQLKATAFFDRIEL